MKDFGLSILFFAGTAIGVATAAFFVLRFRLLCYCLAVAKESLVRFKAKDLPFYYSSYAVKQECIRKFFRLPRSFESILMEEAFDDIFQAIKYSRNHRNGREKYRKLLTAQLYSLQPSFKETARRLIADYKLPLFAPRPYRALYYYLLAQAKLYETDLKSASVYSSKALELYQKLGFVFEQGETYLLLAQIYRITGIYDVAHTMLREAKKCFEQVQFSAKIAETAAYTGLLELGRENFNEAVKILQEASDIASKNNLVRTQADLSNWLGLAYYLAGETEKAKECFEAAYKAVSSYEGQVYAAEMLARILFKTGDLQGALRYVNKALSIGKNICNETTKAENLYLKAEILHCLKKDEQSARILTDLIRQDYPPSNTFYPANAYTLLGLIKLEKNELALAKTLFKQAVDLEHGRNRLKGAAVDYNNLAEVAFREGNSGEAELYLKQAVAYAEKVGDNELASYLIAKLK